MTQDEGVATDLDMGFMAEISLDNDGLVVKIDTAKAIFDNDINVKDRRLLVVGSFELP